MTAFAITISAVVFCMAAILAKNSMKIEEIQHRIDSPMYGPMIDDDPDDMRS